MKWVDIDEKTDHMVTADTQEIPGHSDLIFNYVVKEHLHAFGTQQLVVKLRDFQTFLDKLESGDDGDGDGDATVETDAPSTVASIPSGVARPRRLGSVRVPVTPVKKAALRRMAFAEFISSGFSEPPIQSPASSRDFDDTASKHSCASIAPMMTANGVATIPGK